MIITATELKMNIGKYLALAAQEDIYITKNGKNIAKLTNTQEDRIVMAKSLFGALTIDTDGKEARLERLSEK